MFFQVHIKLSVFTKQTSQLSRELGPLKPLVTFSELHNFFTGQRIQPDCGPGGTTHSPCNSPLFRLMSHRCGCAGAPSGGVCIWRPWNTRYTWTCGSRWLRLYLLPTAECDAKRMRQKERHSWINGYTTCLKSCWSFFNSVFVFCFV